MAYDNIVRTSIAYLYVCYLVGTQLRSCSITTAVRDEFCDRQIGLHSELIVCEIKHDRNGS